jgi:Acetoacetate decarboxylase (ADC)
MTVEIYPVTEAAGLPETRLPYELLTQLPTAVSGAPWKTHCDVVTWLHPLDAAALDVYPDVIRPAKIALVAWALVRYSDTPVGPYSEVAATLIPDGGDGYGHIPFIVVDSLPSIVGGRANWLLPKALASFDWSDDGRSVTVASDQPREPAWSMTVWFQTSGAASELSVPNHVQQVTTDGDVRRFDGEMTGTMTSAKVEVEGHADGPLAAIFTPGSYDGTALTNCTFEVGPLT